MLPPLLLAKTPPGKQETEPRNNFALYLKEGARIRQESDHFAVPPAERARRKQGDRAKTPNKQIKPASR